MQAVIRAVCRHSSRFFSREAPSFRIDGFELAAIDRHDAGVQEIEAAAKGDELLANLADVATIVHVDSLLRIDLDLEA